jgi:hypothetical protein
MQTPPFQPTEAVQSLKTDVKAPATAGRCAEMKKAIRS